MKLLFIILLTLLMMVQYKLWFSPNGLPEIKKLNQQLTDQTNKNNQLEKNNEEINSEIDDLKYGDSEIESYARKDFGMIKPGEKFYQIAKDEN
jgi:cell division protein FtsB